MATALRYIFLLAIVSWIGGIVFFSFLASPSIFKMLPREQAGQVVGDIFPKYHLLGYLACATAVGSLLGLRQMGPGNAIRTSLILLALMGGIQVTMGVLIGPMVTETRDSARAAPPGTDKERMEKKFRALHGVSMILNLTLLIVACVLLYHIAIRLQV